MMDKDQLLQEYFTGTPLTDEQQRELNTYLEKDPDFREKFEFELEKDVKAMVQQENRAHLKARLQALEKRENLAMPAKPKPWRPLAIAASLAVLISLAWYLNLFNTSPNYFEEYYQPYPNTEVVITRNTPQSLEVEAFSAYDMEDFNKASLLFEQLKGESNAGYIDFYLGQCYLEMGNISQAIASLTLASNTKNDYQSEGTWYLALAQLKAKDEDHAKEALQKLVSQNGYKAEEAAKLLEKLK